MSGTKTRVLVVDDSGMARDLMCQLLAMDPAIEVVGTATNGKLAVKMTLSLAPDILVMDISMPVMDGLHATTQIMANTPTPILLVSGTASRVEGEHAFEALGRGALDVSRKPGMLELRAAAGGASPFSRIVKLLATVKVIRHTRRETANPSGAVHTSSPQGATTARLVATTPLVHPNNDSPLRAGFTEEEQSGTPIAVIAIGSSTGGPHALCEVLGGISPHLGVPILITHHIAEGFEGELATWLGRQTGHRVEVAGPLSRLKNDVVYVAPPRVHMTLQSTGRILLRDSPPVHFQKPSVDVLFHSIAECLGPAAVGIVLSGMGRDGASGLLAMRTAGSFTVAQDEATSIIFGMPRVAIELGAARDILPVSRIGARVTELITLRRARSAADEAPTNTVHPMMSV